ncbi:MAG: RNA ligase [Cyanobacteria bacterium P01_A01_bin.68]
MGCFTLISRGLILDANQEIIVATPFPKFFNYGEAKIWNSDQEVGEVLVSNKYDGSLGIVFFHNNKWRVATRGAFFSDQAVWGQKWFDNNIDNTHLKVGDTYLFEIIYLGNRIVIPYEFEGMVLLSAYHESGWEYQYQEIKVLANKLNIKVTELYRYESVESLVKAAQTLNSESEGWIVRFANGHRLKIKGDEYCRIHKVMTKITPLAIWEMLVEGDNLEAIQINLPEEYLKDFNQIKSILETKLETLIISIKEMCDRRKHISDKDAGLAIKKGKWSDGTLVNEIEKKFLFAVRKQNFFKKVRNGGDRFRRVAFETFRPTGNHLDGYIASSTGNRF